MIKEISKKRIALSCIMLLIPTIILFMCIIKCSQGADTVPQLTTLQGRSIITPSASAPMPGDTIYRPIAWGAQMRPVPGVIFAGRNRKYGNYWFTKAMAYSLVKPVNYQQDSIRERVAFADSTLITNSDTFYICRRIIL